MAFQVAQLSEAIPPLSVLGQAADLSAQARAVLGYLLVRVATLAPIADEAWPEDPATCPNCGAPCLLKRSPYCGEACREVASFVRQFRSGVLAGWIGEEEKQVALGQNLWHLLGGGRPLRSSLVPEKDRLRVIARDGGLCPCGKGATMVDHIATGCNRTINLRAVCVDCNRDRPFGDPVVLGTAEFDRLLIELATRIGSDVPTRACDDAASWDWRAYLSKRSATAS